MAERAARAQDWLGVREALERVLAAVEPLPTERVALLDALGRTLAEDVDSPIDQPPWDNSAMDGFAARAEDVRGATGASPVRLRLLEEVPAGGFPSRPVGPGECTRIMTGAPVPEGADSVIRIEHTDQWGESDRGNARGSGARAESAVPAEPAAAARAAGALVAILQDGDAGRNIRRRGEDLRTGERVLEAGAPLRPAEIGVLASMGRSQVAVHRRPRVAILANGDELAAVDDFHEVLAGRRIVDSNSYALAAAALAAGAEPVLLGIARDDEASLRERLAAAAGADALVTAAGASVGDHDVIKDVLEALGFELDFWRVRMKPGSPFSFGRLGGLPVFGLPGNPVSALVTFEVLVRPALRRLAGRRELHSPVIRVVAGQRLPSTTRLTHFLRVRLRPGHNGPPEARLTGPQGSGILTSMTGADALAIVPEGMGEAQEGAPLDAIPLAALDDARATIGFDDAIAPRSHA